MALPAVAGRTRSSAQSVFSRPHHLDCLHREPTSGCSLPSPSLFTNHQRYGNVNPLSIDYAVRPRLRARLTQSGRALLWNPWGFGALDSHQCLRYSSRHSHFCPVHTCLPLVLHPVAERSPTAHFIEPTASVYRLVPFIFGAGALDQ